MGTRKATRENACLSATEHTGQNNPVSVVASGGGGTAPYVRGRSGGNLSVALDACRVPLVLVPFGAVAYSLDIASLLAAHVVPSFPKATRATS